MHRQRMSGILLHPTSLPGPGGIGSFGSEAYKFIDFLANARQTIWQVLPLGPTGYGNSPYSCYSAFAGNPLLIDLVSICEEGDLFFEELREKLPTDSVDYSKVSEYKLNLLRLAAGRFLSGENLKRKREFWQFCDSTFWLHDYSLFMACKEYFRGKGWNRWPFELVHREQESCISYAEKLGAAIGEHKYMQWQFFKQWRALKNYANAREVRVVGDAPIFVAYDSADVWCNQRLFRLNDKGVPQAVAGVPPDYFSKTGQRWGNPLYDWKQLASEGYAWWIARLRSDLGLYDIVRIDHFRGFEACWEIPTKEKTAVKGCWVKGPGESFFTALRQAIGHLPLLAEDLGVITPEVESLRDSLGLPGMKILQFAFDSGADNPYLPHNHVPNSIVYTGTHDNDTTEGWFTGLGHEQQRRVCKYFRCDPGQVAWEMIRAALASVSRYAVIPMQDLLRLGSDSRMNVPGVAVGNWGWRLTQGALGKELEECLRDLSELYNRCPS